MFDVSFLEIEQWVVSFLLPLFRVASFFMVVPMIGSQLVPMRIRLGVAIIVAILIAPLVPVTVNFEALSLQMVTVIVEQILIGTLMGFVIQVLFQVFVLGAQIIAMQMGLGFASMSDPANGVSVAMLGQFYLMMVMLLFLAMDGHLVMIEVMARSFFIIPVGNSLALDSLWRISLAGTWLFSSAMLMALPAVTGLLIINFAFGVMTRAAPQLNIFAIGFPFTMVMGLFVAWASFSGFLEQYWRVSEFVFSHINSLLIAERAVDG
ncbi:MAG: flagellar biosynthetic protein FliR [Pontibacterium sp.]